MIPRHGVKLLLATGVLIGLGTCTGRELTPITEEPVSPFDNKLKLQGKICTTDPNELDFPLKVLFVIDTSHSMKVNDPIRTEPDPILGETLLVDPTQATGRSRAVRQVIRQFIDLGIEFPPVYCNTGETDCDKGNTACPACASVGTQALCVGPDCCPADVCQTFGCPECHGTPICPAEGSTNGTCLPLCDVDKPGCGPGEGPCPDCPNSGSRCLNGICSKLLEPGVEFAIMRFGSAKQVITRDPDGVPGFTSDPAELVTALPQLNNSGSVTDYEGALDLAFSTLADDMKIMQKENAGALGRSKYHVIFLSDGQPDPQINDAGDWYSLPPDLQADLVGDRADIIIGASRYNVSDRILSLVKDILRLKTTYGVGDIKLHTAFLNNSISPASEQDAAVLRLKQMALVGNGTFRNFRNGEEINFLHVDFSKLRRIFSLKSLIVSNINGRPSGLRTIIDSDGDGISDAQEELAGTSTVLADTDNDGFSDSLEYNFRSSGADPLDPTDSDCTLAFSDLDGDGLPDDRDGDGLRDCEERFVGTNSLLFDTDADGLPDGLEVRFGTNPIANDTLNDLDFDGMPNGDEIRIHTAPNEDDAAHRSRTAYRYDVQRVGTGIERVGVQCGADSQCPQGRDCIEGFCRCIETNDCSSLAPCDNDAGCVGAGDETCIAGQCVSEKTCEQTDSVPGNVPVCVANKHITCYQFAVENITLVSPKGDLENGWNNINLYFGQVPIDSPKDFGIFSFACVRARFNDVNGAKLPSSGILTVPQWAWKDPAFVDPRNDCVCPDGQIGSCFTP